MNTTWHISFCYWNTTTEAHISLDNSYIQHSSQVNYFMQISNFYSRDGLRSVCIMVVIPQRFLIYIHEFKVIYGMVPFPYFIFTVSTYCKSVKCKWLIFNVFLCSLKMQNCIVWQFHIYTYVLHLCHILFHMYVLTFIYVWIVLNVCNCTHERCNKTSCILYLT